jgi:UDP-glucose 4-epimerase
VGEQRNFLALTRAVASGRIFVPGRGDNRMSLCHVDNLCAAVRVSLTNPKARGVIHVADAAPVSFRQLVHTLAAALGRRAPIPRLPMPLARAVADCTELVFGALGQPPPLSRARLRTLTADFALDTSRARQLDIPCVTPFVDGVRSTVDWYRAQGLIE